MSRHSFASTTVGTSVEYKEEAHLEATSKKVMQDKDPSWKLEASR